MKLLVKDDLMAQAQVKGLQTLVRYLTNEDPIVVWYDQYVTIDFTPQQRILLSTYVENYLKGKPGKIRVNAVPVVFPPVLKVYGKFAIMGLVASFLLGRLTG